MGWVKLDDQRSMNRKLRAAGFAARGLDEAAMCQVAADKTDGHISEETVEMLGVAHRCKTWRKLVDTLVAVGRWEPNVLVGGWDIHDYLDYNPSRAEWASVKERKQEAGRRGGQASAQARGQAPAQASAQAGGQALASTDSEASAQPVPSRPVPSRKDLAIAGTDNPSLSVLAWDSGLPGNHVEALRRLAVRDMEDRKREAPHLRPIKYEDDYVRKAMRRRQHDFAHVLARIAPDLDVVAIIEEIDADDPHRRTA